MLCCLNKVNTNFTYVSKEMNMVIHLNYRLKIKFNILKKY